MIKLLLNPVTGFVFALAVATTLLISAGLAYPEHDQGSHASVAVSTSTMNP